MSGASNDQVFANPVETNDTMAMSSEQLLMNQDQILLGN